MQLVLLLVRFFFFFLIQLLKQKGFNLKYEENVILNFDTLTFIIYSVLGF